MPILRLHAEYQREDVHDIFSPDTVFTPQSGTWGLHGIVRVPDRPGDFVFFVTFGQQQGEHEFEEGVSEDGVLTWQSQPRNALSTPVIQELIRHDELSNTIYLFLRTNKRRDYTFLGTLKYLSHDNARERPVYFQWQILEWPALPSVLERMGLRLEGSSATSEAPSSTESEGLQKIPPPKGSRGRSGESTRTFQAHKKPDYSLQDANNRKLGLAGERLVVAYERELLRAAGREDLAEKVRHVAEEEGDGAGYDVHSWTPDEEPKYIEVKTTRGGSETAFYISQNEVAFSQHRPEHYYLYRIFDYQADPEGGKFFVLVGDLTEQVELMPTQYRAVCLNRSED